MHIAGLRDVSGQLGTNLEKCQGLQVDVIVARWAAGLADVTDHDRHAPLIGVGVAVATLHAMSLNMELHAVPGISHGGLQEALHTMQDRTNYQSACNPLFKFYKSRHPQADKLIDLVLPGYRLVTRFQSTPCKPSTAVNLTTVAALLYLEETSCDIQFVRMGSGAYTLLHTD